MYMDMHIYQCGSKHIHVILQGDAEGMAAFADSEVFASFVKACQEFIRDNSRARNIRGQSAEQNCPLSYPIPDIFLNAFNDETSR